MNQDKLTELHYIAPIVNIPSILRHGILSHQRTKKLEHQSIAKPEVQDLRAQVRIPGGRPLHDYANLYLCARNPMMFKRRGLHARTCVLRVSVNVLDLPNVVVTDQNAASSYCRFMPAPRGLALVDRAMVFADDWRHPGNQTAYYRHRSVKCAEVLVPDVVPSRHVLGAYVSGEAGHRELLALQPPWEVTIDANLFFQ